MSPSPTFIRTVTGNYIRSDAIVRLRPISISGRRPFTEVRGSGGKFLGVIDGNIDAVVADISVPNRVRR